MQGNTIERAYELAQSGECETTDEIVDRLNEEGFDSVAAHLSGPFTRRQIRSLISKSKAKSKKASSGSR